MKNTLMLVALTLSTTVLAQSPIEFSMEMQNNIRSNWFQQNNNYAEYHSALYAEIQTVPCPEKTCVVIRQSSGNKLFDAELIRAGSQALNGVQSGVIVPVEYKPTKLPLDVYFPETQLIHEQF
jgi:hypothetical protein